MNRHKVVLDLDESGLGIVTLDGMPVNTTGVMVRSQVGEVTAVKMTLVLTAVKVSVEASVSYMVTLGGETDGWETHEILGEGPTVLDAMKDAVRQMEEARASA